jgi:uncharacterized ion transporter superfamily protein YfcC
MKSMMLAALLVGLAGAVEVVLRNALVLDTIINDLSSSAQHGSSLVVAQALVGIEIILDVLRACSKVYRPLPKFGNQISNSPVCWIWRGVR